MPTVVVCLLGVLFLLLLSEFLWRAKLMHGEASRKFVHITVGCFVATWPYLMSWSWIVAISVAFLVVVQFSRRRSLFHAVHDVKRNSWGEPLFAVGIGLTAAICWIFNYPEWFFTVALLHIAAADAAAALIGSKAKKGLRFKVFGQTKSVAGSITFALYSFLIMITALQIIGAGYSSSTLILLFWLPLAATLAESIAVYGLDNVVVPLTVIAVLASVQVLY